MSVCVGSDEGLRGRNDRVVAPNSDDCVDEDALAISAGPIQEKENVLTGIARHAITRDALKVGLQFAIAAGHPIEELEPERTITARLYLCALSGVIIAL